MLKGFISLFFYYQWEESLACQSNWFLRRQEGLFLMCSKRNSSARPPTHPLPAAEFHDFMNQGKLSHKMGAWIDVRHSGKHDQCRFFFMWVILSLRHLGHSTLWNLTWHVSLSTAKKSFSYEEILKRKMETGGCLGVPHHQICHRLFSHLERSTSRDSLEKRKNTKSKKPDSS